MGILAGAAWLALRPGASLVDAAGELERAFELRELPFGFEPAAAARLAGGELVVSFARAGQDGGHAPEFEPGAASDSGAASDPGAAELEAFLDSVPEPAAPAGEDPAEVDWGALEPLAAGEPPARVFLVRWPRERVERERQRNFGSVRFVSLEAIPKGGGRAPLAREVLPWHDYAARAVRERRYHLAKGGQRTFTDAVRVDLARPGEPWMLVAIWPPRSASDLEPVKVLLEALAPRSGLR